MPSLAKQIKTLEAAIKYDNTRLHQEQEKLGDTLTPTVATIAVGATLMAGYLLGRKRSLLQLMLKTVSLGFTVKRYSLLFKRFFPFAL
ncbi:MAG: hypothetical protein H0W64_08825 [Gammaproteobacteria bacterium]|nr:hypothetical protein [Gammaproteobacteria bacterium]